MTKRIDPSLIPSSPNLEFELAHWNQGVQYLAGIDEAGRGSLAGPVSAAAVILPMDSDLTTELNGVRDSKQMTPRQRESWARVLKAIALTWFVGFASHEEIDQLGIVPATKLAALRAIAGLSISPQHLLIDALLLPDSDIPQTSLIKGDARSLSIAAASVLAKVTRDKYLQAQANEYPIYGFYTNKGYGTAAHRKALTKWGPCPIHRRSFAPLRFR